MIFTSYYELVFTQLLTKHLEENFIASDQDFLETSWWAFFKFGIVSKHRISMLSYVIKGINTVKIWTLLGGSNISLNSKYDLFYCAGMCACTCGCAFLIRGPPSSLY